MIATSNAMIVEAKGWQPIRTFLQHAQRKPVGTFTSRKSNRAFPWEGYGERHLMWISEADSSVARFLAQPHRLEIWERGRDKPLCYFPDLLRKLVDGTTEIVEVKQVAGEIDRDPNYALKIQRAKDVYEAIGWKFRVVVAEDEVEIDPVLTNADMICADNYSRIGTREKMAMLEAFQLHGSVPYAMAIERIAMAGGFDGNRARAVLHAMICTRLAAVDIHERITADSAVTKPINTEEDRRR